MEKDIQKLKTARILAWIAVIILCIPNVFSCVVLESVDFWNVMLVMAAPLLITLLPLCIFIIVSSSCIEQKKSFTISTLEVIKIVFLCGFLIYSFFIFYAAVEYNTLDFRLMCTHLRLMYIIVSILSLFFGILFALGTFSKVNKCVTKKENIEIETKEDVPKLKSARIFAWIAIILLCMPSVFFRLISERVYFWSSMLFMAAPILVALLPLFIFIIASSTCIGQEKPFSIYTLESIKIAFLCGLSFYLFYTFYFINGRSNLKSIMIIITTLSSVLGILFALGAFSKADKCVVEKDNIETEAKEDIQTLKSARVLAWLAVIVLCIPGFYSLYFIGAFYWIAMLIFGVPTLTMLLPLLISIKDISIRLKQGNALPARKVAKRAVAFICGFALYLVITVYLICGTTGVNATLMWIYAIVNVIALPLGMAIAFNAFSKIGAQNLSKGKKTFRNVFYVFTLIYFIATSLLILYVCTKVEFLLLCGYILLDLLLYVILAKIALCIYAKKHQA